MATYYIVENNQQAGPFTFEQLAAKGITPETNVWTDGMSNWAPASQVTELQALFAPKPEPAPAPQPEPAPQPAANYNPQPATNYNQQPATNYNQQPAQTQNYSYENQSSDSSYGDTGSEMQQPLKDWKTESIILSVISVLCCCSAGFFTYGVGSCFNIIGLVFGVLGIVKGNKVAQLQNTDYAAAKEASESAGKMVKIGAIVMIVVNVLAVIGIAILFATGMLSSMMSSLS